SALVAGQGIALLVSAAVLTIMAVTIALPEDRSRLWFTVAGLGIGVIALLVDLYIPTERLVLPGFQAAVNILMAVFGILLLVIVFSQIRNYSLSAKMVIVAMNAMLIPTVLATTYTIAVNTRAVTENADAQLLNSAAGAGRELDTFISNSLTLVDTSSRIHILKEYLDLSPADRPGSETESVLYTDLQAIANSNTFINSVGLMDKDGIDVADTVKSDIGTNKATHIYVSQPLQTGIPYSTIQISPTSHKFSLYFSAPVRDANENIIGVLRVRYDASVLQQILTDTANDLNLPESSAALLDENQIFLAHSTQPQAILKSVVPFSQDMLAKLQTNGRLPEGQSANDLSVNLPDLNLGLNQITSQPIFTAETFDEEAAIDKGVEEVGVFQMKTQPWVVIFAQPQSIFLTPVVDLRRTYIVYTLAIAVLIVIATVLLARYIAQPLVDLTDVTGKIAAGDLTVQANVTSKDEFGALAQVFNEMTGKLIRRASELAAVAQVSTEAMQTTNTDTQLQQVVDRAKAAFNLYHAHIYLLNEAKDTLVLTYGAGEVGRQMVAEPIPLDREQSLVARAARTRTGVIVNDVYADPGFLPHPLLPETRSEMAVPMTAGDVVIGVFDVQSDVIGRFTDEDIAIQTTLASQIASAVQTARSYTEVQRNEALLSDALNISRLANWEYDLEQDLFTFNDNFYSIFRTSAENVGGYRMSSADYARRFVHPEDAPLVGIEIQKALDAKERSFKAAVEHRTIFADGEIGYMAVRINVERDENGKIVRWYGANQDITERHRLEEINRKRAIQQETLNVITQKIQSATTIEEAMQITAREMGHALGMKPTLVALEPGTLVSEPEGN
ncbi:MAG: GAF domain-containing protein, partial [Chloroflexi bacterium]|nr:GAF domain-containing protein [Chloroflexota bacterium]